MNRRYRNSASKWDLMLLVGRPLAVVGLLLITHGLTLRVFPAPTGVFLVVMGFVIGWTGKIGRTLFTNSY